jgi:hypothetical protein
MSDRYEFNPNFIAQVSAQQSFHGRTCGECAWGLEYKRPDDDYLMCRRVGGEDWMSVRRVDPACPAFVQKGATNG